MIPHLLPNLIQWIGGWGADNVGRRLCTAYYLQTPQIQISEHVWQLRNSTKYSMYILFFFSKWEISLVAGRTRLISLEHIVWPPLSQRLYHKPQNPRDDLKVWIQSVLCFHRRVFGVKKKKTHTFGQDTKFTQPQAWWIHTPLISVSWPIKLLDLAHARATSFLIVAIRWDRYKYLALSFVRSQSVNCGVSRITHLFSNFGQRCYFPTETQVRAPLDSCALVFNAFRFVCWWVVL